MKILSSLFILFFFIGILPVQALSFPGGQPAAEIPWWKFNQTLTNILLDCWVGNYIQWFTSNGVADCKSVAGFNALTLTTWQANTPSWEWLFQKYFQKILNNCGAGRYVRWFDANKNLICENKTQTATLMGASVSFTSPIVTATLPTSPFWQRPEGAFTDSFNAIFATDCWVGKYLRWFDANKNKICGPIYSYVWSPNNTTSWWSTCNASCGPWTKTRTVSCVRNDWIIVADTNCTGIKPAISQNCNLWACCTWQWSNLPITPDHTVVYGMTIHFGYTMFWNLCSGPLNCFQIFSPNAQGYLNLTYSVNQYLTDLPYYYECPLSDPNPTLAGLNFCSDTYTSMAGCWVGTYSYRAISLISHCVPRYAGVTLPQPNPYRTKVCQ